MSDILIKDIVVQELAKEDHIWYTFDTSSGDINHIREEIVIHNLVHNNKVIRFGVSNKANDKFPILSILNTIIGEKDALNAQLRNKNYEILDLTLRLEFYKKSKIINFLRLFKILK